MFYWKSFLNGFYRLSKDDMPSGKRLLLMTAFFVLQMSIVVLLSLWVFEVV